MLFADDRGGVMRTKMAARGAFEAECKGMRPLWPVNVKRRAANVRKPVSFVKQM